MSTPNSDILNELATTLADEASTRYRIDKPKATKIILQEWHSNQKLISLLDKYTTTKELMRTRVFRDAKTSAKRTIYNKLRTYRSEPELFDDAVNKLQALSKNAGADEIRSITQEITQAHISTAERTKDKERFLSLLDTTICKPSTTIVDVGSGVLVGMIGTDWLTEHGVTHYWAIDKDNKAIEALKTYAILSPDSLVKPFLWNIADGWENLHQKGLPKLCDVALLLKLIPVVARQESHLLPILAETPAEKLLISGSRVGMAKRRSIEARERRVLRQFTQRYGLQEINEFSTDDEFFILAERR